MHTKPMAESDGTFTSDAGIPSTRRCVKCGGAVLYWVWETSCGGYEDEKHVCQVCGDVFWIEGIDA